MKLSGDSLAFILLHLGHLSRVELQVLPKLLFYSYIIPAFQVVSQAVPTSHRYYGSFNPELFSVLPHKSLFLITHLFEHILPHVLLGRITGFLRPPRVRDLELGNLGGMKAGKSFESRVNISY